MEAKTPSAPQGRLIVGRKTIERVTPSPYLAPRIVLASFGYSDVTSGQAYGVTFLAKNKLGTHCLLIMDSNGMDAFGYPIAAFTQGRYATCRQKVASYLADSLGFSTARVDYLAIPTKQWLEDHPKKRIPVTYIMPVTVRQGDRYLEILSR